MKKRFTVFNIPWYLKPFFYFYGHFFAAFFRLQTFIFFTTCSIEFRGLEHLEKFPSHIKSVWHEDLSLYFAAHPKFEHPNCWMTFDLWYMKPVHIMKKSIGIKELAFGSSANRGRAALNQVIGRLKEGWASFISPDGPAGPKFKVKSGVLQMSLQSGAPVIPLSFEITSFQWRYIGWDRKRQMLPFGSMILTYHEPVFVTEENYETSRQLITKGMSYRSWI